MGYFNFSFLHMRKLFLNFSFFYRFVGNRVFVILLLSGLTALLDGFGLAMFIPLFQIADSSQSIAQQKEEFGELGFLIEFFEKNGIALTVPVIVGVVSLLFISKGILKFIESYYKVKVRLHFMTQVRYDLLDGMAGLYYLDFIKLDAGRIQNTLSVEVSKLYSSFTSYFNAVQSFILLVIYMSLALLANFQFALFVILAGVLSNFVYKIIYHRTKLLSQKISNLGHEFQSYIIQSVQYFKYLKATNSVFRYHQKIESKIHQIESSQTRIGFYDAILQSTREPLVLVLIMLVILVQVYFLGGSMGSVLLSLMFFYRSMNSILTLQTAYQLFLSNVGSIQSVEFLLNEFKENPESDSPKENLDQIDSLSLEDISFSYASHKQVLDQVSLTIPIKGSIAFVGESGSGKTTLINILSGLIHPGSGSFQVNGQDLNEFDLRSYRQKIGYITQEPVIFNDTIFNNVTFWDEKTEENMERFREAIQLASMEEMIQSLPQEENTELGDNGVVLSGGQRQRISISRELYRKTEVLILDEATSALDSETERMIQENIEQLKGKYTLVMIAHRLSTIRNCDVIYHMDSGKVQGKGTFEELLSESPRFARLVELQKF